MKKYTLGVIGGGFMARAILSGAFSKKILSPKEVLVCDPSAECRAHFTSIGADVSEHNLPAVQNCRYLLFAVEEHDAPAAGTGVARTGAVRVERHLLHSESSSARCPAAATAREMAASNPSRAKLSSAATVVPPLEETAAMSSSSDFGEVFAIESPPSIV